MIDATGRDTRGQGNAKAQIVVTMNDDDDGTRVDVVTDLSITGKVAQFGRGVLDDVSAKLLRQFVENLERDVLVDRGHDGAEAASTDIDLSAASPSRPACDQRRRGASTGPAQDRVRPRWSRSTSSTWRGIGRHGGWSRSRSAPWCCSCSGACSAATAGPEAPRAGGAHPLASNLCSIRRRPGARASTRGSRAAATGSSPGSATSPARVGCGVIRTPPDDPLPQRLLALDDELRSLIADIRPSAVAVERVLFQSNARTAMSVGQASGLALVAAARVGIPVALYSPNEVKLAVTGDGRADKAAVQMMVARVLNLREIPKPADAADALALACCHLWRAPLARAGRAGRTGDHMIGSVRGTVIERTTSGEVLVEVGGVGYRVNVPLRVIPTLDPGSNAFLFTHLHVREDAMTLYGFPTRDERDTFEVLDRRNRSRAEARARDPVGAHAGTRCGAVSPTTISTR